MTKKSIVVLGSTGSIGTQALEVIAQHPGRFSISALTAQHNSRLLVEQALIFHPDAVVIVDETKYAEVKQGLAGTPIRVLSGEAALLEVVTESRVDVVLTALVGFSGLRPTIAAINAGKTIALANKETLVVAGEMVMQLAKEKGVAVLPVDSEHSAIFQCLAGETGNPIEKLYLTASGGPFRGKDRHYLSNVAAAEALKHPNWVMGAKITIDSATLMNKGLEVIEAKWLFNVDVRQIEVVVHPQSIIHSAVQFTDGSIKAQMGLADMRLPIQYALAWPERLLNNFPRFSFFDHPQLTFERPDLETFANLRLAYRALDEGGNMPCVINAANEVVVAEFLKEGIGFLEMSEIIERCMDTMAFIGRPGLDDLLETDRETRLLARSLVTNNTVKLS